MPEDPPRTVGPRGRYHLLEQTSEDRLGSVWSAIDEGSGDLVTVRLLAASARQPARAGAIHAALRTAFPAFRDPYAVAALNYEVLREHHPFVVMERIGGPTLAERLAEPSALDEIERVALVREVGGCLAAAHRIGVTHGALSADSIVLVHGRAKVMDWGLWPLVVERLDADPSRADDIVALAAIARRIGCTIDADGGFPAELLASLGRLTPPGTLRPPSTFGPGRATLAAPPSERIIDLTQMGGRERTEDDDVVDVRPAARDGSFSWTPETDRREPARVRRREAERAVPRILPRVDRPVAPVEAPTARIDAPPARADAPSARVDAPAHEHEGAPVHEPTDERVDDATTPTRDVDRTARARTITTAIARVVATVFAGLILLAVVWRAATVRVPDDPPSSPAPASTTAAPVVRGATVPDVLGADVEAATEQIEAAGLVVDRVVTVEGGTDRVTRSDPTPGEAVVRGTGVILYIGGDASG